MCHAAFGQLPLYLHLTNKNKFSGRCKREGSGIAKDGPDRAQALPNACCALPPRLQNRDTLIEQSNILLKQSVSQCRFGYATGGGG